MTAVDTAMAYAYSKIGDWYQYGAKGPNTFDCSGLTADAWAAAGYDIGAGTQGQMSQPGASFVIPIGANADWAQNVWRLLRGDLLFLFGGNHVQLYDGEGWIVEAPHTGARVQRVAEWPTDLWGVRRVVPGVPGAPLLWPGTVLGLGVRYFGTSKYQAQLGLPVTGVFNAATRAATIRFQTEKGLDPDGKVGRDTWTAAFPPAP